MDYLVDFTIELECRGADGKFHETGWSYQRGNGSDLEAGTTVMKFLPRVGDWITFEKGPEPLGLSCRVAEVNWDEATNVFEVTVRWACQRPLEQHDLIIKELKAAGWYGTSPDDVPDIDEIDE